LLKKQGPIAKHGFVFLRIMEEQVCVRKGKGKKVRKRKGK